jgi:hypothetical protein
VASGHFRGHDAISTRIDDIEDLISSDVCRSFAHCPSPFDRRRPGLCDGQNAQRLLGKLPKMRSPAGASVARLTLGPRLRQVSSPNVRCKSYTRIARWRFGHWLPEEAPAVLARVALEVHSFGESRL